MRQTHESDRLEQAIEAWRHNPPTEQLSTTSRARILAAAHRPASVPDRWPLGSLFLTWRMAMAGAVPVGLMTLFLGGLILDRPQTQGNQTLVAAKRGTEVVFRVSGGDREHQVYRSADPQGQEGWQALPEAGGAFRDRLHDGADVVFYRID